MKTIKVSAPAKINLTLEVLNKREDGFHNIQSIMQAISLYDFLTIKVTESENPTIKLSGNSDQIPYNEKNLVHKACVKFFEKTGIKNISTEIFIEKNIPVEAGLAGGSTDAAATFLGLNKILNNPLKNEELEELCAQLGSDLNFCLHGGTALCTGRGENTKRIETTNSNVTLIKPLGFGISAKEAYTKFAQMTDKSVPDFTKLMEQEFNTSYIYNSLEKAVMDDYKELVEIKTKLPNSLMSGSGPTFFVLEKECGADFDKEKFLVIEGLQFIKDGVKVID